MKRLKGLPRLVRRNGRNRRLPRAPERGLTPAPSSVVRRPLAQGVALLRVIFIESSFQSRKVDAESVEFRVLIENRPAQLFDVSLQVHNKRLELNDSRVRIVIRMRLGRHDAIGREEFRKSTDDAEDASAK